MARPRWRLAPFGSLSLPLYAVVLCCFTEGGKGIYVCRGELWRKIPHLSAHLLEIAQPHSVGRLSSERHRRRSLVSLPNRRCGLHDQEQRRALRTGGHMDNVDTLLVRFYLGEQFVHYGESVHYVGGDEAMSYIEREKVSIAEIVKHLKHHMIISAKDSIILHRLFPRMELVNGLRPRSDATVCTYMVNCIKEGSVADVYVEILHESSGEEESDYEDELEETISEGEDDQDFAKF